MVPLGVPVTCVPSLSFDCIYKFVSSIVPHLNGRDSRFEYNSINSLDAGFIAFLGDYLSHLDATATDGGVLLKTVWAATEGTTAIERSFGISDQRLSFGYHRWPRREALRDVGQGPPAPGLPPRGLLASPQPS